MPAFIISESNTRALKSLLMQDFEMKSSHATEAIAALAGFNSHAAFLEWSKVREDETVFQADIDSFEKRSLALGYDRDSVEWLRFCLPTFGWPDPIWKLTKKTDLQARNRWFYECERRKVPYIVIKKARKYYTVEWDHISMDPSYDEIARASYDNKLGRVLFNTYQYTARGQEPKSFFDGSCMVGEVTGLTEGAARQIADAFAYLIYPGNLKDHLA